MIFIANYCTSVQFIASPQFAVLTYVSINLGNPLLGHTQYHPRIIASNVDIV